MSVSAEQERPDPRVPEVVQLTRDRGIFSWRRQAKVEKLLRALDPGERVLDIALGRGGTVFFGGVTGKSFFVCTDNRIVFPGITGGASLPLTEIASVRSHTFPTMGRLELYLRDGRKVIFKEIQPKQCAATMEKTISSQISLASSPETVRPGDYLDRLQKLTTLRDAGALTPEEFAAEKAHILADR
jgi:Short C-terminal domain